MDLIQIFACARTLSSSVKWMQTIFDSYNLTIFSFKPLIFKCLLEVIGVAELVNKMNGPWFNRFDEDLATAFSIYCGISIAHVRLFFCSKNSL